MSGYGASDVNLPAMTRKSDFDLLVNCQLALDWSNTVDALMTSSFVQKNLRTRKACDAHAKLVS